MSFAIIAIIVANFSFATTYENILHTHITIVFLTALAIVYDLGAIIVIAIFYISEIYWSALIIGLIILIGLILVNRFKVKVSYIYLF